MHQRCKKAWCGHYLSDFQTNPLSSNLTQQGNIRVRLHTTSTYTKLLYNIRAQLFVSLYPGGLFKSGGYSRKYSNAPNKPPGHYYMSALNKPLPEAYSL